MTPDDKGVVSHIGVASGGGRHSFYGSDKTVNGAGFALNHHTYLHVPTSGAYTFNVGLGDADAYLWTGSNAYSGFTKENAQAHSYYDKYGFHNGSYTVQLTKGDYVPVRLYNANEANGGPGGFSLDVLGPDGQTVPDADFVDFNCRWK